MNAAYIAEKLAGRKVQGRNGNYLVPCPAHDDDLPSLSLRDGDRGLKVHCFAGCHPADIYVAIRHIDRNLLKPSDTAPEPAKGSSEYERRQGEKAAWLWSRRRPIADSIAETYLRARGITCPLPPTLAFLPASKPAQHPAMIAAFTLVDEPEPGILGKPRDVTSVHLTLLRPDGGGKAEVKPNKIVIGSPGGRPIMIAPPNDLCGLAITEGIEDALTAHCATGLGAWAAGSAGFMPRLANVVPSFASVTIFAHPDKAGQDNAHKLAAALRARPVRGPERRPRLLCDRIPPREELVGWQPTEFYPPERPIEVTMEGI